MLQLTNMEYANEYSLFAENSGALKDNPLQVSLFNIKSLSVIYLPVTQKVEPWSLSGVLGGARSSWPHPSHRLAPPRVGSTYTTGYNKFKHDC